MAYNLIVRDDALKDVFASYDWYEKKQIGLGKRFYTEVQKILGYIKQYPHHYQVKFKNIREGVLKIFPYVIIYEILDNDIIVYSVFPTKDNPDKKPK
ncbi:type II toxin-antitoxin system RelE/ParE family toxin [Hyunsoonleella ulvae]|uniref:type II toxin-antitoxin system RelE/ParE family toxin n=1 Tax=Hyunsoonleella ulvae TaxID=2799948 RepID=UPI00193ACE7D|nr:type II toxin-antitoxin system RelE/ParE family toxin [Hyunsoonleella ulvae]